MPLTVALPERPIDINIAEDGALVSIDFGQSHIIGVTVSDGDRRALLVLREIGKRISPSELPLVYDRHAFLQCEAHELSGFSLEPMQNGEWKPPFSSERLGDVLIDSDGRALMGVVPPSGYTRGTVFGLGLIYFDLETGKAAKPKKPISVYREWRMVRRGADRNASPVVLVERRQAESVAR